MHGPGIDNPWAYLEHDGAGGLVRYYHADLLGSIRLITDGAGDVIQAYDLGAARPGIRLWRFAPTGRRPSFGETTECLFPFPFQPFQYAAREDDPDSKLDYNRARYYNPRAGRFISPDPLGAAGGRTNRFLYVGNSPTRFKDPSGFCPLGGPSGGAHSPSLQQQLGPYEYLVYPGTTAGMPTPWGPNVPIYDPLFIPDETVDDWITVSSLGLGVVADIFDQMTAGRFSASYRTVYYKLAGAVAYSIAIVAAMFQWRDTLQWTSSGVGAAAMDWNELYRLYRFGPDGSAPVDFGIWSPWLYRRDDQPTTP